MHCETPHSGTVFARFWVIVNELSKTWRQLGRHEGSGFFPNSQKRAGIHGKKGRGQIGKGWGQIRKGWGQIKKGWGQKKKG